MQLDAWIFFPVLPSGTGMSRPKCQTVLGAERPENRPANGVKDLQIAFSPLPDERQKPAEMRAFEGSI